MKPSYTVSSVNDLPKNPAIALTTATLELDLLGAGEEGGRRKLAAFQWRKGALDEQGGNYKSFFLFGPFFGLFTRAFFNWQHSSSSSLYICPFWACFKCY